MKTGMTISCIGHAVALRLRTHRVLGGADGGAAGRTRCRCNSSPKRNSPSSRQGIKNAPKLKIEMPKPLADKVDAPKAIDQLAPKVADKPEIKTDSSKAALQPKPETKPDPKPVQKADKPQPPEYKPDQIADLLKKDAPKKPAKPDDQSAPQKADAPKFDANQVAELLDKRDPQAAGGLE